MDCPTCRRAVAPPDDTCPRCGADLRPLHALLSSARRRVVEGREHLKAQRAGRAQEAFAKALEIRYSDEAQKGHAVACLCAGRYRDALKAYRKLVR